MVYMDNLRPDLVPMFCNRAVVLFEWSVLRLRCCIHSQEKSYPFTASLSFTLTLITLHETSQLQQCQVWTIDSIIYPLFICLSHLLKASQPSRLSLQPTPEEKENYNPSIYVNVQGSTDRQVSSQHITPSK